ncbi:MAG: hypothetical protein ABEJ76_00030 [Halanaeroarchaeum sp.]
MVADMAQSVGIGIWLAISALGVFVVYRSRPADEPVEEPDVGFPTDD